MAIEAITVVPVLKALVDLGMNAWTAYKTPALGEPEQKALKSLLDTGLGLAGVFKGDSASSLTAAHFALVTRAFGEAFRRYWHNDPHFAPGTSFWDRNTKGDATSRARAEQIEERLRIAASKLIEPGGQAEQDELKLASALVGDPKNTPYFRKLWGAYFDPSLLKSGEEPLIAKNDRQRFERLFDLAYAEGLSSPQGEAIRNYLLSLNEGRAQLVRDLLIRDMASWGSRHVFGTVGDQSDVPVMPLSEIYVEPLCLRVTKEGRAKETRPVLGELEALLKEHEIVVLRADFGHGKSLSARTLAQRTAEKFMHSTEASPQEWRPIFVKCAQDFESHSDDLKKIMRRAQHRLANENRLKIALDDAAFDGPPTDHKTLVFIDGLDEVALSHEEVKGLFRQMRDQASDRRRFLVFSRPAVLPSPEDLGSTPVLELCPLRKKGEDGSTTDQIEDWLNRWNKLNKGKPPITPSDIASRGLDTIAGTPILLFMICHSWGAQTADKLSLGDVYEAFFQQIAQGKHSNDCDRHEAIAEASEKLRDCLRKERHLPQTAKTPEAMLWLMGRVAWKAKCLEDALWLEGEPEPLDVHHVRTILRDELKLKNDATMERTIQMGMLLALQANLQEGTSRILFGHRSFQEYLVARYWKSRLEEKGDLNCKGDDPLLQGRLMTDGDKSFSFLVELLAKLPEGKRKTIAQKTARCFNDESMLQAAESYWDDKRPLLREAALAIACSFSTAKANSPRTLRSLLAWFWLRNQQSTLIAPQIESPGAQLNEARLNRTLLINAQLNEAQFNNARLNRARLNDAQLIGARLNNAQLNEAQLNDARLNDAQLINAQLNSAQLNDARLNDALLIEAQLIGALLIGANLQGAWFGESVTSKSSLQRADVHGAEFQGVRVVSEGRILGKQEAARYIAKMLAEAKNPRGAIVDPEVAEELERLLAEKPLEEAGTDEAEGQGHLPAEPGGAG